MGRLLFDSTPSSVVFHTPDDTVYHVCRIHGIGPVWHSLRTGQSVVDEATEPSSKAQISGVTIDE